MATMRELGTNIDYLVDDLKLSAASALLVHAHEATEQFRNTEPLWEVLVPLSECRGPWRAVHLQERSAEAPCNMGKVYPESCDSRGNAAYPAQGDRRTLRARRSAPALVGY
jgi:hypothetical protein